MDQEFFYNEPRLLMTRGGRFVVRFFTFFAYAVTVALIVLFMLTEEYMLKATGALLALFLIDRMLHVQSPERLLSRAKHPSKNIAHYVRPEAYRVIELSFDRALHAGGDVGLHVLGELLRRPEIRKVFSRLDVDTKALGAAVQTEIKKSETLVSAQELREQIQPFMREAFEHARSKFNEAVELYDLLAALPVLSTKAVQSLYTTFEILASDLETACLFAKQSRSSIVGFLHHPRASRHRIMNRSWTARPTPTLDRYSVDFTDTARAGESGFLVGHGPEYERLITVLSRPTRPNALLVGEAGVGKEALLKHVASQIAADRVPTPLFDKRLVVLSITSLCAGAESSVIQERVKVVLNEIKAAGNIILYIPAMHELLLTGAASISGADVLISGIASGEFSVIGATDPKNYKQQIEPKGDLAALFEVIRVEEMSEVEALQYLIYASLVIEHRMGVVVSFGALKKAVELAHRFFRSALLPTSAENLLSETVARAVSSKQPLVTPADIIAVAETKTNVALHAPGQAESEQLLNLESIIHKQFIDQEEAVRAVSASLREYRSGLARKGGPIASFLFVGPTGVGKTELSKILSQIQFGSKDNMIRFDMTEYQDKQSFFRLIGSPDGTTRGALTEAVREKPYSLILLDEFEKAYPDILNLFLQVFDDGRLTDNMGRTVDFQNVIIIATSNAHSTLIKQEMEKGTAVTAIAEVLKQRLTEYFRPELLNRFSNIIVFKPLSQADIVAITRLAFADLAQVLGESHAVKLTFSEEVVAAVARLGYDPVYGARPLRAVISDKLRSPLAEKILKGEVARGTTTTVRYENGTFLFE